MYVRYKVSVCVGVYVCLNGYVFRRAVRYQAETWQGVKGRAPEVCLHIFKGQRSSRGQSALEMSYGHQIW